jgi:hypothetical protein
MASPGMLEKEEQGVPLSRKRDRRLIPNASVHFRAFVSLTCSTHAGGVQHLLGPPARLMAWSLQSAKASGKKFPGSKQKY